jgi:hypothetical protein
VNLLHLGFVPSPGVEPSLEPPKARIDISFGKSENHPGRVRIPHRNILHHNIKIMTTLIRLLIPTGIPIPLNHAVPSLATRRTKGIRDRHVIVD